MDKTFPQKIASYGYEVRTFMPKFGQVNERRNQLHEVIRLSGINIPINNGDHPLVIKVASLQPSRIQVYFIDNDDYFTKSAEDVDPIGSNRKDNDERIIYFAHGTADTVKKLLWDPAVVHVSGWFSALLPFYLKKKYSRESTYLKSKIIYSVLPGEVSGGLNKEFFRKLREEEFDEESVKPYESMKLDTNLLHAIAIDNSDGVIFHMPDPPRALSDRVKKLGIPVLKYSALDENGKAISEFYKQLTDEK
ncbi:MAG: glycogen/starch synthase [Muribaculaceae bacterium]|nr:glycogen/starch synthase [Muribaculaceae bacterium]